MLSTMGQSCRELEGRLSFAGLLHRLVASVMCAIIHKHQVQISKSKMLYPRNVDYQDMLYKRIKAACNMEEAPVMFLKGRVEAWG